LKILLIFKEEDKNMRMSYIVCKDCYAAVPFPYRAKLPTDDEKMFDLLIKEVREKNITCPKCGGHK
jgi:hypothetical protein